MGTLAELIKKTVEALAQNSGFNEIELSDGSFKVHLVRYTPMPYYVPPAGVSYPWPPHQP